MASLRPQCLIAAVVSRRSRSTSGPSAAGKQSRMLHVFPDGFQGLANKEVASALDLAVETVHTYRKNADEKVKCLQRGPACNGKSFWHCAQP
jgi:DNA-binding NarL/FixJ family response regulator